MKIYLRKKDTFSSQALALYEEFFKVVENPLDADIIVINDFEPIEADKIVACNSTGLDHIKAPEVISLRGEDLSDLTAVPELCLGASIALTRQLLHHEVKGKTLGIIGFGRIGKKFKEYAKALGMEVWAYDSMGTNLIPLEELLPTADIVSIHITADEDNRGYFDNKKFAKMKRGAILLNSSRPWLVDYDALKYALDTRLAGAWFDFEMPFAHEKLFTTPHLGGTTKQSKEKSEFIIAEKLKRLYA